MKITEALKLTTELARENMLSERETDRDSELEAERERQERAIRMVERLIVTNCKATRSKRP